MLDPGVCEEEPLGEVLLPLRGVVELPGAVELLPDPSLELLPEVPELMPDCEPLVPLDGEPTLLLEPLCPCCCCCCIAIVRVSDWTICSRRATRASIEPEPLTLVLNVPLPLFKVPLLVLEPSVPELLVAGCPKLPLAEDDDPGWEEDDAPSEPWREDEEPDDEVPDWPLCAAPLEPMELWELPLAPFCELEAPGVLLACP